MMAKNYISQIIDLRGDKYLNPDWSGHYRSVGVINNIAVHHDASFREHDYDSVARYRSEAAQHYNVLGPGLQYHFKIDNVGQIFWIRPLEMFLWHSGNYDGNTNGIAICLDGYFHPDVNQVPTREQYEALKQLLDWLCTQHPEFPAVQSDVYPHRHYSATACCGDNLVPFVDGYRTSGGNIAIPEVPYDWPEFQPQDTPPVAPQPQPIIPVIEINYRVFKDSKQIGAYKIDSNAWNKYKAENGTVIKDGQGNDITAQLRAKFEPIVPEIAIDEDDRFKTINDELEPILAKADNQSKPTNIKVETIKVKPLKEMIQLLMNVLNKMKGSIMKKIIEFLQGKKTYIIIVVAVVYNVGVQMGWWNADQIYTVNTVLAFLGLGAIRAGVAGK